MRDTCESRMTVLLNEARQGNTAASEELLPLVYDELRKLAADRMARLPRGQTFQPTGLVHEAYLRLIGKEDLQIESRKHFFFLAARAMRDILVEHFRAKKGKKRGGDRKRVELTADVFSYEAPPDEVLALHEVLQELEKKDPVKAEIVNLRYFAGMSVKETAEVMGMSERTLMRHWRFTRAWLYERLKDDEGVRS